MGSSEIKNILGDLEVRDEHLPFHKPWLDGHEEKAVVDVIRSGWLTRGDKTAKFEELFTDYVDSPHAIALSSCTAALHLALLSAGVEEGDEVITTPYTFAATANTIIHTGAKPVFCDIDPLTLNIDCDKAAEKIGSRTRAIVPVHFGGYACDMNSLNAIADEHGLVVIEDAAHALGASYDGRKVGSISPFTAFSFYATKNITTGEGGMLTVSDPDLARRVRVMSLHGMSADAWNRYDRGGHSYYEVTEPGYKYNMTDLQAAIGVEQLKRTDEMLTRRASIMAIYDDTFAGHQLLETLSHESNRGHACHLYVVLLRTDLLDAGRDEIASVMEAANIGVSVHFQSLHLHPYYRDTFGYEADDLPVAAESSDRALSLPIYPLMSDDDVRQVAATLDAILQHYSRTT